MRIFSAAAVYLITAAWPSTAQGVRCPSCAPKPSAQRLSTRAVSLPDIGLPIADLTREDLHDMFTEYHHGHPHRAIDLMRPRGTPVVAAVPGRIRKLHLCKLGGITIYEFDETGKYCYYYAHLDHYVDGLYEGMYVEQGQTIGYVGSTGDAVAKYPHLHFAIYRLGPQKQWGHGMAVDPYRPLVTAVKRADGCLLTPPTPSVPAITPDVGP